MTEKKGKIWGTTQLLFKSGSTEVHLIEARAGGYCSRHKHQTRTNQFFIIDGLLAIALWDGRPHADITILAPGESTTIPISQDHLFVALEDTKAIEIYQAKCMAEDIDRKWHGGLAPQLIGADCEALLAMRLLKIEQSKEK